MRVFEKYHQEGCKTGRGREILRKLSEVNARAVSRRQNELEGKFKMAAGDMVSIRGQVMEYTYITTGIKREMVRSGVDLLHITCCHLEPAYQFVLSSRHSSGINLR